MKLANINAMKATASAAQVSPSLEEVVSMPANTKAKPEPYTIPSLVSYYSQWASEYDARFHGAARKKEVMSLMPDILSLFYGRKVIDVGCGTGLWTQSISNVASEVTAVDNCFEMVLRAKSRMYPHTVRVRQENVFTLSTISEKHNAAYVGFLWRHIPKVWRRQFLKSLHNKLQPGSTVVILDGPPEGAHPIREFEDNFFVREPMMNGSMVEILHNVSSEDDMRESLGSSATNIAYANHGGMYMLIYKTVMG